jgi:uncharacterized protein (DUF885 family)
MPDQLDYDVLGLELRDRIVETELGGHLMPITNREGFHVTFANLAQESPLATTADYEHYIARLAAFDRLVADHIELMREGMRRGMVLPAQSMPAIESTIAPHVVDDPTASRLYEAFAHFPPTIAPADQEQLRAAGRAAIAEHVVPGYRSFLEFVRDEYAPQARESIAAATLPKGRDYYRHRTRMFTTLDISPEEVHQIGLREVERIGDEMEAAMRQAGFAGTLPEFLAMLRSDPRFYPQTKEELLKEIAWTMKQIDGQLPRLFATMPRTPCGIREIPDDLAPITTTAYYQPAAGDGSRPGYYMVNTYNLSVRPLYEVEALTLHEAIPGHHFQIALQQELTDLAPLRRFGMITAYVEGWALYCERLGLEMDLYHDPYSNFGRLSYEMWRACRLVVDTGIHYDGWSREQAIAYMTEHTALSLHNIAAEVDRYIAWPGQALGYKMGEIQIRQLRERAERELGADFDIRQFHDVILCHGALPLSVLERVVEDYIRTAQARQR